MKGGESHSMLKPTLISVCSLLLASSFASASALEIKVKTIEGKETTLGASKPKAVLVVNTASRCGYTRQYKGLQALHEKYAGKGLLVAGFPCNQFGGQEPGTEADIKAFCEDNYDVEFPMFSKVEVNGETRHPLYTALAGESSPHPGKISWNFEKFLVDADGKIIARFKSGVKPTSAELTAAIEKLLK